MIKNNVQGLSNFRKAWDFFPRAIQAKIREEIKIEAAIDTYAQFHDRKIGRVIPREYEALAIIKVFAKWGVDAVTGEKIEEVTV